jgi:hypothetical protein
MSVDSNLYTLYPEVVCRLFHNLTTVDGAKKRAFDELLEVTKDNRTKMISDLLGGLKAL